MTYNFDKIVNRKNTNSYKWDMFPDPAGTIPMPVADMDFECAPALISSIQNIANHRVYGYAIVPPKLNEVAINYHKKCYNWTIDNEWMHWLPGMVPALYATVQLFEGNDNSVICPTPIYHPFHMAIAKHGVKMIELPLILNHNGQSFDLQSIENQVNSNTKLFMLCNPQNPGGKVYTKAELVEIATFCEKYNLLILSDEIHCDLLMNSSLTHVPIATVSEYAKNNSITLTSTSKTFNIAAMGTTLAIIPNATIKQKFLNIVQGIVPMMNVFSINSAIEAYSNCEDWKEELLIYLRKNHDFLYKKINQIPGLEMNKLEATYLAWIDYSALKIDNFHEKLIENGIRLIDGPLFMGKKQLRLNFACPKSVLEEAINRIEKTVLGN